MKFSFNWLKEYIDFSASGGKITPEKLAEFLTDYSFETTITRINADINADKRGHIRENQRDNPRKSAQVEDIGENLRANLRKSTYILDADIPPNRISDAANYLGMSREIAAILNSRLLKVKDLKIKSKKSNLKTKNFLSVKIEEPKLCRRYVGKIIFNVKVGQSPLWLKERLELHGMRSINNIVDAANFIMLETGQPLHAFDYDKLTRINADIKRINMDSSADARRLNICANLRGNKRQLAKIVARRAKKGERITTLENEEKILDESVLVIADGKEPLAIAGIKGGKKAEITEETKNIILESANFSAENIYLNSRKIGIKTDASLRFEHDLDPYVADFAIERLADLICKLAGGVASGDTIDVFPEKPKLVILDFDYGRFEKFAGFSMPIREILKFFERLGFQSKQVIVKNKKKYLVAIPGRRRDILIQEDLYEEILRLYGYNKIPAINPVGAIAGAPLNEKVLFKNKVFNILISAGYSEAYNYSFLGQRDADMLMRFNGADMLAELENPLAEDKKYLIPNLFFGLLKNAKDNFRYFDNARIFEIGKIFRRDTNIRTHTNDTNKIKEERKISGIVAIKKPVAKNALFFEIKGLIEAIFEKNGLDKDDYSFRDDLNLPDSVSGFFDDQKNAAALSPEGVYLGCFGEISKEMIRYCDIDGQAAAFELDFEKLLKLAQEEREYTPLPVYPSVIRDVSMIVNHFTRVDDVLNVIYKAGAKFVEDVDLFDIYSDEDRINEKRMLPEGKKSMAFHIIFQAGDHTLTDEEVGLEMSKIISALKNQLKAEIR